VAAGGHYTTATLLVDNGEQRPHDGGVRGDKEWRLPAQRAQGRTSRLAAATFITVCSGGARYGLRGSLLFLSFFIAGRDTAYF